MRSSYFVTYPCPQTTVKLVDVSDPSAPTIRSQIPIEPKAVPNDVDALRVDTPSFSGVLLAIALVRCSNDQPGNATQRGVHYNDITDPSAPRFMGRYIADENLMLSIDPPCSLASTLRCASSNDNVELVQRADGTVLSLSTEPFSSNSQPRNVRTQCGTPGFPERCAFHGDVRIVDVTNPASPTFVGSYPNAAELNGGIEQRPPGYTPPGGAEQPISTSNNGCRNFNAANAVGIQSGVRALVPYFDAGLLTVDIGDPSRPSTLGRWAYPTDRTLEANAAYVDFAQVGGRDLALIGENDWIGPESSLRIDGTSAVAGSHFACEASFTLFDPEDTAQVYRQPGSQVPGQIVYVGRACPADTFPTGSTPDLTGKIAFRDRNQVASRQPTVGANCTAAAATARLQALGAAGVVNGNTSATAPQAVTLDGDPRVGPEDLVIPVSMIDTGAANALRDVLCPAQTGGGCGPGGQTVSGAMVDGPGEWGGLRVVDVTDPGSPFLRGTYHPPGARVFPPPDLGVYAIHHAVARGSTAFVAGHSNGLRAIDLTSSDPTEIDGFVPPDTPDPTGSIPAEANVVGVDVADNGAIVASDINSGLYVLRLRQAAGAAPPPPPAPAAAGGGTTPPPAQVGRLRGRLSARVTPSRDLRAPYRFRISGRLTRPSGVARVAGCRGRVSVQVKRGRTTISTRRVSLRRDCTYSLRVSFRNARRFASLKRLRFTARFTGNARILPATAPARFARVRR